MRLSARNAPFRDIAPALSADGSYRPVSFWQETVEIAPSAALERDDDCDVAVIGGGFTGLSVAFELKKARPELDVVIVEREVVGHGASGRNGGFVMPLLGWSLAETVHKLGEGRAGAAYRIMYEAVAHTVALVRNCRIDCDLEETGYILLATCPARAKHVREEAELGEKLGFDYRLLDGDELRSYIASDSFSTGCLDPRSAIINPAKLARGLLERVRDLGVRVYEQTPVTGLEGGEPVTVTTPRATLRGKSAVLAVNAYGGALGFLPARVLPVHTYIVLTEPLDQEQLAEIGWAERRASLETARNFIHYFRLTADHRILFGGHDAKLFWRGRFRDRDEPTFAALEAAFRGFFPALERVGFSHRWGGPVGVTLDMFPAFGVIDNVFYGTGYSGHGVALSNYAGRLLAPRILAALGTPADAPECPLPFGRKPPVLPPDPLRYLGMQLYRLGLHAQDRWQRA